MFKCKINNLMEEETGFICFILYGPLAHLRSRAEVSIQLYLRLGSLVHKARSVGLWVGRLANNVHLAGGT